MGPVDIAAWRRVILRVMLGCLAASAAMAVVALLTPWGVESYRLVGTTVAASIT